MLQFAVVVDKITGDFLECSLEHKQRQGVLCCGVAYSGAHMGSSDPRPVHITESSGASASLLGLRIVYSPVRLGNDPGAYFSRLLSVSTSKTLYY